MKLSQSRRRSLRSNISNESYYFAVPFLYKPISQSFKCVFSEQMMYERHACINALALVANFNLLHYHDWIDFPAIWEGYACNTSNSNSPRKSVLHAHLRESSLASAAPGVLSLLFDIIFLYQTLRAQPRHQTFYNHLRTLTRK